MDSRRSITGGDRSRRWSQSPRTPRYPRRPAAARPRTAANASTRWRLGPPLGQEILFRALVDGKYGLFVMNLDGTEQTDSFRSDPRRQPSRHDLNGAAVTRTDGSRILLPALDHPIRSQLCVDECRRLGSTRVPPRTGTRMGRSPPPRPTASGWPTGTRSRMVVRSSGSSVARARTARARHRTGPARLSRATLDSLGLPDSTILLTPGRWSSDSPYLLDPAAWPLDNRPMAVRSRSRLAATRVIVDPGDRPRRRPTKGRTPGGRARGSR